MQHSIAILIMLAAVAGCGSSPALVEHGRSNRSSRCADERSYYCLGALRVRPYLLESVGETQNSRGTAAIERLGRFDVREAIGPLRQLLAPGYDERLRTSAAEALAALEDRASAPLIASLARALERGVYEASWERVTVALATLDVGAAAAYARDWMTRHPRLTSPRELDRAQWVVDILRRSTAVSALPGLIAWSRQLETRRGPAVNLLGARLLAARAALGEEPLRTQLQRRFATPDMRVPVRPDLVLVALGSSSADAPGLARIASSTDPEASVAYDGIDRLAPHLGARDRAALIERMSAYTHVREDPSHPNFSEALLARHHASLARLGHEPSRRRLAALASLADGSIVSFVAAQHALLLEIPGAADGAHAALATLRLPASSPGPLGTRVPARYQIALLDAAVAHMGRADGRWAVALLAPHMDVHERAVFHLARLRPPSACDAVFPAIPGALERVVRDGLVPLTLLGDTCRPHLEQLVTHPQAPPEARGPALEVLAMIRAPSTPALIERYAHERRMRGAVARARDIYAARYR